MYEAPFCCTMRYAEGLPEYYKRRDIFTWDSSAPRETDNSGRTFIDDVMLVKYNGKTVPLFSCNDIPENEAKKIEITVI